jgi:RNA-directed DNA polymerase
MRRTGNLFQQIVNRDNLRLAFSKAVRGKLHRPEARRFAADLEGRLRAIGNQLQAGAAPVGEFHQFVLHDPKERVITAPCFAERILHHAVMNVCEPIFDRWLIDDTFACRTGRGREAALRRALQFAHGSPFFLKLDIRKYFDSVPHENLLRRLERLFKDRRLLELFARMVRGFRPKIGRGLPIGSLTSQHFANFYLGWFDRFVKETLHVRRYVRYMDDVLLWAATSKELQTVLIASRQSLQEELGLELKQNSPLNRTAQGVDFLGCRVFPTHLVLNRRSRVRFSRKCAGLERSWSAGLINELQLQARSAALVAFATAAGVSSWHFRRCVVERLSVSGHKARTG